MTNSFSYKLNCQIQLPIYDYLDKSIENVKYIRILTLIAYSGSSLCTLATRVTGLCEVLVRGVGILITSPSSSCFTSSAKNGLKQIFVETPKNSFYLFFTPVEVLWDIGFMLIVPRLFILIKAEYFMVDLKHAEAGTIGSVQYQKEHSYAAGRAYRKSRGIEPIDY